MPPRIGNQDMIMISPSSGYLGPSSIDDSDFKKSKVLIDVKFCCQREEPIEIDYVITGLFGEEPIYLKVRGKGSHDGHYNVEL